MCWIVKYTSKPEYLMIATQLYPSILDQMRDRHVPG